MGKSGISYFDETWNVTSGCTPCSPGCLHCWAKATAERFPQAHTKPCPTLPEECVVAAPFSTVLTHPDRLSIPLHWRKPRVVGVSFMGDLFHKDVPDEFLDDVFTIMNGRYDRDACLYLSSPHTFLVLTKRPERMRQWLEAWFARINAGQAAGVSNPFLGDNLWLGCTICNQEEADEKIPILLDTPAVHRWVSVEPMLGPVDLAQSEALVEPLTSKATIDQVIVGCESGAKRRSMMPHWWDDLREQCVEAGVPVFLKQQAGKWDANTWHPSTLGQGKVHHFDPEPGELAWRE